MNWRGMSAAEFVKWISLNGADAIRQVVRDYEQLPWSLRLAWWALFSRHRDWFRASIAPSGIFDLDNKFWSVMWEVALYEFKAEELEWRVSRWLVNKYPDDIGEDWFLKMILEGVDEDLFEKEFAAYERSLRTGPIDRTENMTEAQWDEKFAKHGLDEWLFWDLEVPISCLDRWRRGEPPLTEAQKDGRDVNVYILLRVIPKLSVVPDSWIKEMDEEYKKNPKGYYKDILGQYLRRRDVPIEVRKTYRKDPNPDIRKAAWLDGEYDAGELDGLTPDDLMEIAFRRPMDLFLAKRICEESPDGRRVLAVRDKLDPEIRLLLAKRGEFSLWWREDKAEVLDEGLDGSENTWKEMGVQARSHWGQERLERLLLLLLALPDTGAWTVRRLLAIGKIGVDKRILGGLMASPSQELRLLASELMGRTREAMRSSGQRAR